MDIPESRMAHPHEAESDDFASPANLQPAGTPAGVAACAGAPPGGPADRLAFDPVPLRHRTDGLTPERQRAYVEALADTGIAREAAARVGLSEQAISRVRRRCDARSFDLACGAAHRFGARRLRSIAFERAIEGTIKGHYYHGELKSEERVYDNRLLIYLLGKTEHLLEEPEESRAICANWEPWMDALEQGLEPPEPARPEKPAAAAADLDDDFSGEEVWWEDGVRWTGFPAPDGFDGEVEGEIGDPDYQRTLTAEEEEALDAREAAGLTQCCADRDRFFGLPPRGSPGISSPREAEPYETSGSCGSGRGPVEQSRRCGITPPDHDSEGGSG